MTKYIMGQGYPRVYHWFYADPTGGDPGSWQTRSISPVSLPLLSVTSQHPVH